jgi:hypothetical protein
VKTRWITPIITGALALGAVVTPAVAATVAAPMAPHHHGRFGGSDWSGYAVTGSRGEFRSVSASWTEPTATCAGSHDEVAFWAGLDGYYNNTVEQTGSAIDCSSGTPQYSGWYEMYPAAPVYYANSVQPGDHMKASVVFSGTGKYTMRLTDSTEGWSKTTTAYKAGLQRSSAEAVTEAPEGPPPDFNTVTYNSSSANGSPLGTQSPVSMTLANHRGQQDSTGSISGLGSFSNTWQ